MEKKIGKFYKINEYGELYKLRFDRSNLGEEEQLLIKELYHNFTHSQLSKRFNVSTKTIQRIYKLNNLWIKIKLEKTSNGYRARLNLDGKNKKYFIHRLVLEAFVGPRPIGMIGCHNDNNHFNNHVSNLRWDTYSGNAIDEIKNGTDNRGEKHNLTHLSNNDVITIRYLWNNKYCNQPELAKIYKVKQNTISKIVNKVTWRHI